MTFNHQYEGSNPSGLIGSIVKRLRHNIFTVTTWVRPPVELKGKLS